MAEPAHYAVIERIAAEAMSEIREAAQCARLELGIPLMLYIDNVRDIRLPSRLVCPECGGPLTAEIEEWETADGQPTDGGVLVYCETDWNLIFEDSEYPHRYWQSDWDSINYVVTRFVRRRVRVIR